MIIFHFICNNTRIFIYTIPSVSLYLIRRIMKFFVVLQT